jgi:hypothetical protein
MIDNNLNEEVYKACNQREQSSRAFELSGGMEWE